MKELSLKTFIRKYSTDEACLEEIFQKQYPEGVFCQKCQKKTAHFKIKNRMAYSCTWCRNQVYPLVGTIFEKSSVSLTLWFYAIFLMTKTRSGISAKQLERELEVCYKTAHRMFKLIRKAMNESDGGKLQGEIEVDETYIGANGRFKKYQWAGGIEKKQIIMGMVERNGRAYLKHVADNTRLTLLTNIEQRVEKGSHIFSDQYQAYNYLPKIGYTHDSVNHSETYVTKGTIHTQNVEGLWSILKRGIYGVYRHVSIEYLQQYANEYAWRYNNRHLGDGMFDLLLSRTVFIRQ